MDDQVAFVLAETVAGSEKQVTHVKFRVYPFRDIQYPMFQFRQT